MRTRPDTAHPRPRLAAMLIITIVCCVTTAWSQPDWAGKRDIDVATVNLYVGADFTPVITLDPSDPAFGAKLITGVAQAYGRIIASNFPKRADALALELVARGPELIALQEVSLLRRQSPGDAIGGGTAPATTIELDFLAVLLQALAAHGGHYAVVSKVENTDVEVPLITSPVTFDDIRLTDRDVILMRTDLPPGQFRVSNPLAANFGARLPLPIGISVLRGWCSVDVQERGYAFRFINTHLEDQLPAALPNLQGFQALELLAGPATTALPVLLAGDFNSDANGNYSSATYRLLTDTAGFSDAWTASHGAQPGLTWGHDELLADPTHLFSLRLDLVLFRGAIFKTLDASVVDPVIGALPPLWFSDHAAVFANANVN